MHFELPVLHRKTLYFIILVFALTTLVVIGSELPVSANFDGIWKVMAFNILLVAMLLINAADQRREFRVLQFSKVRLLAYVFCMVTFWWAVFRQTELAGGIPGITCTSAGVAQLYPAGTVYGAPYVTSFLADCDDGWAELVNYAGASTGTKCCVDTPANTHMNCSSGVGLVPDLSRDTDILTEEGRAQYAECCPKMVGKIIPPGITTMLLSAVFGIFGNVLFNAFKRTPVWDLIEGLIYKITHSSCVKAVKERVLGCGAMLAAWWSGNSEDEDDDDDVPKQLEEDMDVDGIGNNEDNPGLDATSPAIHLSVTLPPQPTLTTELTQDRRPSTARSPQMCEYAFDRTVRSMLGAAAIASAPCGSYFAVSALHDDGKRHVAIYDVEGFKERARPTVHHQLWDTLRIPQMVEVAVSPNGRWLAVVHKGRRAWSLYLADDGSHLATWRADQDQPPQDGATSAATAAPLLYADISFAPEPFGALASVLATNGMSVLQWNVSVKQLSEDQAAVDLADTQQRPASAVRTSSRGGNDSHAYDSSRRLDAAGQQLSMAFAGPMVDDEEDDDVYRSKHLVIEASPVDASSPGGTEAVVAPSGSQRVSHFAVCSGTCVTAIQHAAGSTASMDDAFETIQLHRLDAVAAAPYAEFALPDRATRIVEFVVSTTTAALETSAIGNHSLPEGSPLSPPQARTDGDGRVESSPLAGRGTPVAWGPNTCRAAWRDNSGNIMLLTIPPATAPNANKSMEEDPTSTKSHASVLYESTFNRWSSMALSPNGDAVACGRRNGSVCVMRPQLRGDTTNMGPSLLEYHHHSDVVTSVCFLDDDHVAASGRDGLLTVADVREGREDRKNELDTGVAYVRMVLFPDGNRLACVTEDNQVHIQNVAALTKQEDSASSVPLAVSSLRADGTIVVAVFNGVDRIEIHHATVVGDGRRRSMLPGSSALDKGSVGHTAVVFTGYLPARSVYLNPSGTILVALCRDGSIATYSLATVGPNRSTPRTLDASRQLGHRKRGPFCAMESVSLQHGEEGTPLGSGCERVLTVGVERRAQSYRLHLFDVQVPTAPRRQSQSAGDATGAPRRSTLVLEKIDLSEHLFAADRKRHVVDVPLTAVAFSADAHKLCLWIGADVFVCDVDVGRHTVEVVSVLQPSPLLKEEKIFAKSIRLKATGGALQIDSTHGGRVLRIIEHDQHFYIEEWHNVFKERVAGSGWLVDTNARFIRFRSHLEVSTQAEAAGHFNHVAAVGCGDALHPTTTSSMIVTVPSTSADALLPSVSKRIEKSAPQSLEIYGYPKSQDPMKHKIRYVMNVLFPLLRTDELAANTITAMLLPRGEGVITSANCGTAFWPRDKSMGANVTFEVSKFTVDMFQPSEFLVVKAVIATILGVIGAFVAVARFDDYPVTPWSRFAIFCTALTNGPIYSSVIDPISALTVHLHLQRSGLFPVAGNAWATTPHLYADRNSFHKAYLTVGGSVFVIIAVFWIPGFTAVGPFYGSLLLLCAAVSACVRLLINSPLISVSNATADASCHRQVLAWLRHILLFLLCLVDNVNINFFLQTLLRFPVNTGVILFGGAPYPFFPYIKSETVGPALSTLVNRTLGADGNSIPELPYMSIAGAAVAHVPFYMMQMSSGSCNAVKLTTNVLDQIDTVLLFL